MRFRTIFLRVGLSVVLIGCLVDTAATAFAVAPPPLLAAPLGLSLTEVKITGDEFVALQNNSATSIPDLSKYWLYAFNKTNTQAAGATSTAQQLPTAALPVGASVLLSGGGATCGAAVAAKLLISLADTAGALQLLASTTEGLLAPTPVDAVSWSTGSDGDIANLPKSTTDKQAAVYRTQLASKAYGWQLADVAVDAVTGIANVCQLNVGAAGSIQTGADGGSLQASVEPLATISSMQGSAGVTTGATMPTTDVGLAAPQITELLPNPTGTGNDATDEFIELYNANTSVFDLSGFTLQTGTTTKHSYAFPSGTTLPAKSFTAFNSADTGLSLSNSGGAADLLDPFAKVLSQTTAYSVAKDGQAWALADGSWQWTTQPTPGAANVIMQSAPTNIAGKTTSSSTKGAVKGSATKSSSTVGSAAAAPGASTAPIHPLLLAAIATLAVGYGIYEYRQDIGNKIHQFRTNRTARRKPRTQFARR